MTKGHGLQTWVVSLLLLCSFAPLATASGGGLLLSGDSFNIIGDQEVGVGDINISVDVVSHNSGSNGFLEMTFTAGDNTPLASDNRSITLSADQSTTEIFDIDSVPIGTHTFTLQLWGDVGVAFDNNLTQIQVFIQRLSPASVSIDSSNSWSIVPVNSNTGEESGNVTLRDGDHAWVIADASNSGDVNWTGNAIFSTSGSVISDTPVNIAGLSSNALNFTLGPLVEGDLPVEIELVENGTTLSSDSMIITVGPPPLARPIVSMTTEYQNPSLGESINWTVLVDNSGESSFSGVISCSFPTGVQLLNESAIVPSNENLSWNISLNVRPGTFDCNLTGSQRIHDDSVTTSTFSYDMSAAHLMRAGGDGLTVTGGPFHVGDPIPLAILIHNGGDFSGSANLQIREGDSDGNNMGSWIPLESRTLEVGSSLELGSEYYPIASGERQIEWRIVSTDSLVANDLAGTIALTIQPSQSLEASIVSLGWSIENGLSVEVTTTLSPGETRLVLLEVGTSGGASGDATQISINILLSPGQRTLPYNLGHPPSSSTAWVEITTIGWSSSTIAQDEVTIIRPAPRTSVTIDSVNPERPIQGEAATITFSLYNEGGGDTIEGDLMLIDLNRDGEVLWPISGTFGVPAVPSGETYTGSFNLPQWPNVQGADLNLIWHTPDTSASSCVENCTFLSQIEESTEESSSIDWMSLVYGSIAGLFIGLVTRTVMRARAGEPLLTSRERKAKSPKSKKSESKSIDEKVEVACPSCDQRLRVPTTYSGNARCPACAQTFPVEAENQVSDDQSIVDEDVSDEPEKDEVEPEPIISTKEKESSSNDDVIQCPDCEQKLKVPFERRPVRARCPACKCEFRALKG
ncbi:MAG: hypothetical protein VX473_07090 [Candidatus Thermoplasmatota archaeon]|nr:hypothetical protein [Candidatus Thermoplasmatota archaeon]